MTFRFFCVASCGLRGTRCEALFHCPYKIFILFCKFSLSIDNIFFIVWVLLRIHNKIFYLCENKQNVIWKSLHENTMPTLLIPGLERTTLLFLLALAALARVMYLKISFSDILLRRTSISSMLIKKKKPSRI